MVRLLANQMWWGWLGAVVSERWAVLINPILSNPPRGGEVEAIQMSLPLSLLLLVGIDVMGGSQESALLSPGEKGAVIKGGYVTCASDHQLDKC